MLPPPLISLEAVSHEAGGRRLFTGLDLAVHPGERLGLIGPNGSGKSTLARILAGEVPPEQGRRTMQRGVRCAFVPQDSSFGAEATSTAGELLARAVAQAQRDIAELEHHASEHLVLSALKFAELSGLDDRRAEELSGGQRKRLQILMALILEPQVLVMDEPTNHLDLETTEWLEEAVLKILESPRSLLWGRSLDRALAPAFVMVSHDRAFLDALVTRMVEIDGGSVTLFSGNYTSYLGSRAELDASNKSAEARLSNRMRQEREWLSRGPRARGTKQQARIERAARLDQKLGLLKARNQAIGSTLLADGSALQATAQYAQPGMKLSKQVLFEVKGLTMTSPSGGYAEPGIGLQAQVLFDKLELKIRPAMRLAIVGPNGSGKSTLLRALHEATVQPHPAIHVHDQVRLSVLDQERRLPAHASTIRDLILPGGGDTVFYGGRPLHVSAFLEGFRFAHASLNTQLNALSGGERARILLARALLDTPNVLILDEPTNDLDLWILRDLEEHLLDFAGAVVFTSHDRYFLNRVATHFLAWAGHRVPAAGVQNVVSQWHLVADLDQALSLAEEARHSAGAAAVARVQAAPLSAPQAPERAPPVNGRARKPSYRDTFRQQELERLIPQWEAKLAALNADLSEHYASGADHRKAAELGAELNELTARIEAAYEELEALLQLG